MLPGCGGRGAPAGGRPARGRVEQAVLRQPPRPRHQAAQQPHTGHRQTGDIRNMIQSTLFHSLKSKLKV